MSAAVTLVPAKIRKILPLLASTSDPQVLAAARGAERVLASAGQTYHDLAAAVRVVGEVVIARDPARSSWPTPRSRRWASRTFTPRQEAEHRRLVAWCVAHDDGRLTDREREFLNGIASRRGNLSIKQADWLADIALHLENEGGAA